MFSLLLAGALLCLALFAFRRHLVIPWFVCTIVEHIAWPFGWQVYVRAQGGPGWHRGRVGADAVHFIRRDPNAKRVQRLKVMRTPSNFLVLLAPLAMLALAGCNTTKLDADIAKSLPAICTAADQAHGVYQLAVAAGKVSAKNQRRADAAWASLEPLCADPASQTTAGVITTAFAAYLTISTAAH